MTYQRDPVSVRFDRQAQAAIGLTIAQREKHDKNTRLVEYVRLRGPSVQPAEAVLRDDTEYRLAPVERSFLRALYYDSRIHQMTGRHKPDARWSLKVEWGTVPVTGFGSRLVTLRVFSDTSGARHAQQLPKSRKFSENEALQSGAGRRDRFAS